MLELFALVGVGKIGALELGESVEASVAVAVACCRAFLALLGRTSCPVLSCFAPWRLRPLVCSKREGTSALTSKSCAILHEHVSFSDLGCLETFHARPEDGSSGGAIFGP